MSIIFIKTWFPILEKIAVHAEQSRYVIILMTAGGSMAQKYRCSSKSYLLPSAWYDTHLGYLYIYLKWPFKIHHIYVYDYVYIFVYDICIYDHRSCFCTAAAYISIKATKVRPKPLD